MKKLFLLFFLPTFLFGQDVTRTWDDTTLIVENVVVNGLISGVAELEFETVAQMKAFDFSTVANGARVKCNGYNVANDGFFGPDVFWNAASTTTDDGLSVFDPVASGAGRLERSFTAPINVTWAGAVGDYDEALPGSATDNSAAIQTIIEYLILQDGGTILFPEGNFALSETLQIKYRHHKDSDSGGIRRFGGIKISGVGATNNDSIFEGMPTTSLVAIAANTTGILDLVSATDVTIENLAFVNQATSAPHTFKTTSYARGEPNGNYITDAAITATDNTLTSASNPWVAGDVGEVIRIEGADTAGGNLVTTIASFTSAGEVELTDAAVTTVSGEISYWPEPVPNSTTHITVRNVIFQDDTTITDSMVDLQNTKFIKFENCTWITGSRAVNIGEDVASEPAPLMNGDVNNLYFSDCIFAGDIGYKQGRVISWVNCEWYPVKNGSGVGAAIVAEGNEILRGASLINCKAIFDGNGTGTFFDYGDQATNLVVMGGLFGDYNRAFVLSSSISGVATFIGTNFDNGGTGDRDIEIKNTYKGKVYISAEHDSTIFSGSQAVTDARSSDKEVLRYQVAGHKQLPTSYTLTGATGMETVLSMPRRLRGGMYRVTLACNVNSLHSSVYRMRLKSYNQTTVDQYIISGESGTLFWTGILRISAPTPTTTSITGTITSVGTALTGSGTNFDPELTVGDWIEIPSTKDYAQVASITNDTNAVLEEAFYYGDITGATGQSVSGITVLEMEVYQENAGGTSTVTVGGVTAGNTFMLFEEL